LEAISRQTELFLLTKVFRRMKVLIRKIKNKYFSKLRHHHVVWQGTIKNLKITKLETVRKMQIYIDKKDIGYHSYSNNWWNDLSCPYCYQYFDIDSMYESSYYNSDSSTGHPDNKVAKDIYNYMQNIYKTLFGDNFKTILELGTGGGEFTYQFVNNGLDVVAVEGTIEGVKHLKSIGVPNNNIIHSDIKFLKPVNKKFDIAMCTEVAEHIEPWFASKIVENCIIHSDVVWFSAADINRPAHYHHMNEVGIEAWDNIFAHMGFPIFIELDKRYSRADRLYISKNLENKFLESIIIKRKT
jgi:2-polyprenyl-3-methyl-5-hydroxy-6-metoxy-1,4-benzoquinol methylase